MKLIMNNKLSELKQWFEQGEVFAYPTEAVFGLGCDPQNKEAVHRILELKKREVEKGVILVASDFSQIAPYVDFTSLPEDKQEVIQKSWPGPVTWLLPKTAHTPDWISGDSDMVAVRLTAHPLVRQMCDVVNQAIVSTSANPASLPPARNHHEVAKYFGKDLHIIQGNLGKNRSPSKILHSQTMETIRA
jgi:L-threonylcarbamoyladenylate synthase